MGQRRHLPAIALDDAAALLECSPAALAGLVVIHDGRRVVPLDALRRIASPAELRRRMAAYRATANAEPPPARDAA